MFLFTIEKSLSQTLITMGGEHWKGIRFDGYEKTVYSPYDQIWGNPPGCYTDFLFTTYINTPVNLFYYNKVWDQPNVYLDSFRIDKYKDGVLTSNTKYGPQTVAQIFNTDFGDNPTTSGTYRIEFWSYEYIFLYGWMWIDRMHASYNVIKKIDNVWFETSNICETNFVPVDNKVHFKLKTAPYNINDILYYEPHTYATGVLMPAMGANIAYCEEKPRLAISIKSNGIITDPNSSNNANFTLQEGYSSSSPFPPYRPNYDISGFLWNNGTPPNSLFEDFWVDYNNPSLPVNFKDYVDGIYAGEPLYLDFHISDNVLLNKDFQIPIIINHPNNAPNINTGNPSSAYHLDNYTVSGKEFWTPTNNPTTTIYGIGKPTLLIEHKLTIPAGKSLTIHDMNIEFGPEGSIVIEADPEGKQYAGFLNIFNTTLTAMRDCGNETHTWEGVTCEGNATKDQIGGLGKCYQGLLRMNNSEISYANCGFNAHNTPALFDPNKTGGVILAYNSRFINNHRAVEFEKYDWNGTPNRSYFTNCSFLADNLNTISPFYVFITGWDVHGVKLTNCTLDNQTTNKFNSWGIYGSDMGLTVDGCKFSGLGTGIYDETIRGANGYAVRNSDFNYNYIGIHSNAIDNAQIMRNNFLIPDARDVNFFEPDTRDPLPQLISGLRTTGVFIETGNNYEISSNNFNSYWNDGRSNTVGVHLWNTGAVSNKVYLNNYKQLNIANLSNYNNLGLRFLCNYYTDNTIDEAAMGNAGDGMASKQMDIVKNASAGNEFNGGAFHQFDIYNDNGLSSIDYYYDNSSSNKNPILYFNINAPTLFTNPNLANDCQYEIPKDKFYRTTNNKTQLAEKINYYLTDNTGMMHRDSLYYYLNEEHNQTANLLAANLYVQDGNYEAANAVYNAIKLYDLMGNEQAEYLKYGRQLLDLQIDCAKNKTNYKNLNAEQVTQLETIANEAKTWAKIRAQNWLHQYDGRQFPLTVLYPNLKNTEGQKNRITGAPTYQLLPNPVTAQLTVEYNNAKNNEVKMTITDMMGKEITTENLEKITGTKAINASNWASGLYFYKITNGATLLETGKFIKQ